MVMLLPDDQEVTDSNPEIETASLQNRGKVAYILILPRLHLEEPRTLDHLFLP